MLPALSGILPDGFRRTESHFMPQRSNLASCAEAAGNMPAVASKMLAVPFASTVSEISRNQK